MITRMDANIGVELEEISQTEQILVRFPSCLENIDTIFV
jgi:hypothetical protein